MASAEKPALYRSFPVLDGMRAISILWVLLYHLPIEMPGWLIPLRGRGELGVELFFAISGFLVTRSLYQCLDKNITSPTVWSTVRDFFVRRISRIFPPYFLVLAFLLLIALFIDASLLSKLSAIKGDLWVFPFFVSNYFIPFAHTPPPDVLGITWSLAFEEQFYIFLIFLFIFTRKQWLSAAVLSVGFATLALRFFRIYAESSVITPPQIQMLPHLRFDALSWGCLAWIFYEKLGTLWVTKWRGRIVNTTILCSVLAVVIGHHWYIGDVKWQAFIYSFTGLIFAFSVRALCEPTHQKSFIAKLLSHPISVFIGILSYEIYLVHEIVIGFTVRIGLKNYPFIFSLAAIFISIGTAFLFHRFYSLPTQKWVRERGRI